MFKIYLVVAKLAGTACLNETLLGGDLKGLTVHFSPCHDFS